MNGKAVINFNDVKKLFEGGDQKEKNENKPSAPLTYPQAEQLSPGVDIEESSQEYPHEERKLQWLGILFWIGVVVLAFTVGFAIVNGPAIAMKISYWFDSMRGKTSSEEQIFKPEVKVSDTTQVTNEDLPNNHLIIPKINVDAPIVWGVEESQVQDKLLEGAVQYKNTATPDLDGGNVFITGHSSNYWWTKSDYNQVFALLPQLEIGDKIILTYNKVKYVYQIYDQFVVNPDQVEVIKPVEGESTLTLMSCVPIGTNLKRLIIRSKLLYKDEGTSQSSDNNESEINNTGNQTTESSGIEKPVEIKNDQPKNTSSTPSDSTTNNELFLPILP